MALITWNDKYSVKVGQFDADHKQLVQLINQLHNAIVVGRDRQELGEVLAELTDYTLRHFAAEEALMRQTDFPELSEHIFEHQQLRAAVTNFTRQITSGSLITLSVMQFMRDWFLDHVLKTDMRYSEHLRSQGGHIARAGRPSR
jgi:hemerythrin